LKISIKCAAAGVGPLGDIANSYRGVIFLVNQLRPALKQPWATGDGRRARRWAWIGFILTILAIGFLTRAIYAAS